MQFTSRYQGKAISGLVGSSVNFTWGFSGDVGSINWGLPNAAGNILKTKLVTIDQLGFVSLTSSPTYTGRVNGSRSGKSSSSQVIFTLSNIDKDDEGVYGCLINPTIPVVSSLLDSVHLVITGG